MLSTDSLYTPFKPASGARLRLFCFPYAGGGSSIFHAWSRGLPPEIQVCTVQLPGRENRLLEPPFCRITPLVEKLAAVLMPHMDIPFAFFGHSMGALIGFELARELRRLNRPGPGLLAVSAYRAPQLPLLSPPIHQLSEPEFLKQLSLRYDAIPSAIAEDRELMKLFASVLKADLAVIETYVYSRDEPLACPISAFGGLTDRQVPREDLSAWRSQTQDSFKVRMVPGHHFFLNGSRSIVLQAMVEDLSALHAV